MHAWKTWASAAAILAGAGSAAADISNDVFTVTATSSLGSGSLTIDIEDGVYDDETGMFTWNSDEAMQIVDPVNQNVIATLMNGNVTVIDDPIIGLNFIVVAGGSDTDFTITSPLVSGIGFAVAEGRASAGLTLTDSDGDGASVSGDAIFQADFNGLVPNGTNFATLLEGFSAGAFETETMSDEFPIGDGVFAPINEPVDDMSSQWSFSLTANDQLGGTSVFVVVPSPGGVALLGVAGLGVIRRRRTDRERVSSTA